MLVNKVEREVVLGNEVEREVVLVNEVEREVVLVNEVEREVVLPWKPLHVLAWHISTSSLDASSLASRPAPSKGGGGAAGLVEGGGRDAGCSSDISPSPSPGESTRDVRSSWGEGSESEKSSWSSPSSSLSSTPSPYSATIFGSSSMALLALLMSILGTCIWLQRGHWWEYTAHHGLSATSH